MIFHEFHDAYTFSQLQPHARPMMGYQVHHRHHHCQALDQDRSPTRKDTGIMSNQMTMQ